MPGPSVGTGHRLADMRRAALAPSGRSNLRPPRRAARLLYRRLPRGQRPGLLEVVVAQTVRPLGDGADAQRLPPAGDGLRRDSPAESDRLSGLAAHGLRQRPIQDDGTRPGALLLALA